MRIFTDKVTPSMVYMTVVKVYIATACTCRYVNALSDRGHRRPYLVLQLNCLLIIQIGRKDHENFGMDEEFVGECTGPSL